MPASILVVEDDQSLGFLLTQLLEEENYNVKLKINGADAWQTILEENFDVCILDIMMPKMDGLQLAKRIRQHNAELPFIFLTARSMKADKMKGYEIGAEDYITKPFDEDELLWKIKVILRRGEKEVSTESKFEIGDYFFDYALQELTYKDTAHRLTEKESDILRLLCLHKNQILRREDAVEQIYGKWDYFLGRSFDVFISRLRKLLSQDGRIKIENVFKVGFILKVEGEE
ncbi:MAG: response regulator transcription factor [Bacteroidota bacterium]